MLYDTRQVDALDRTPKRCLAYLAPSHVCGGLGVFAKCDLSPGSFVTAYAGVQTTEAEGGLDARGGRGTRRAPPFLNTGYVYVTDDGTALNGARPGNSRWTRHGLAQMANDAIDADLSGRNNNCEFREFRAAGAATRTRAPCWRVYLRTTRSVKAGEELLVSYGLDYWLHPLRQPQTPACRDFLASLPSDTLHYLCCHLAVERCLAEHVSGLKLTQFHGYTSSSSSATDGTDAGIEMIYIVTFDAADDADDPAHDPAHAARDGRRCCVCLSEDGRRCARWVVRMMTEEVARPPPRVKVSHRCTWCEAGAAAATPEEENVCVMDADHHHPVFHTIMSLRRKDL